MAYVAVNVDENEFIYKEKPTKYDYGYVPKDWCDNRDRIVLPKGSIEKLIGKKLTWEDEPVELKEEN